VSFIPPEKEPPVPVGWEARWAPEPVRSLWRREKWLNPARNRNPIPRCPVRSPAAVPTELQLPVQVLRVFRSPALQIDGHGNVGLPASCTMEISPAINAGGT
jgi:hypothetical protein